MTTTISVYDTLKMIRETLCVAQTCVGQSALDRRREHVDRIGRLITDIDRQRPLDAAGRHGDGQRCTTTCGCET